MRILGVDISSVATGWCVLEDGEMQTGGVIRPVEGLQEFYGTKAATKKNLDQVDKAVYIALQVAAIVGRYRIDQLVVEDCFLKANVRTLQLLARLSGAVLYAWFGHMDNRKPLIVSAAHARASLGCKGNAEKPEVIRFIRDKYGLVISKHDMADAFMLARYYHEKVGGLGAVSVFTADNVDRVISNIGEDSTWHYFEGATNG